MPGRKTSSAKRRPSTTRRTSPAKRRASAPAIRRKTYKPRRRG